MQIFGKECSSPLRVLGMEFTYTYNTSLTHLRPFVSQMHHNKAKYKQQVRF